MYRQTFLGMDNFELLLAGAHAMVCFIGHLCQAVQLLGACSQT